VRLFLKRGWRVVIADRNLTEVEAMVESATQAGQTAYAKQVDVADEQSVQDLVDWSVAQLGRIDACVHAAGIGGPTKPFHTVEAEQWQQVIDIDLTGTFFVNKAMVNYWLQVEPRLVRDDTEYGLDKVYQRGAIVNVASVNSTLVSPMMGSYGQSQPCIAPNVLLAEFCHPCSGGQARICRCRQVVCCELMDLR
jgi:NAD(P)-dependent dehydrogenase (short-subunit alcohol dehydrogenase family)